MPQQLDCWRTLKVASPKLAVDRKVGASLDPIQICRNELWVPSMQPASTTAKLRQQARAQPIRVGLRFGWWVTCLKVVCGGKLDARMQLSDCFCLLYYELLISGS